MRTKQVSDGVLSFWSPFWKLPGKAVVFIISKNCQKLSTSCSVVYNSCCTPPHAPNAQGKGQSTPCHGEAFAEHQGAEQTSLRWAIRESRIARPRPKHQAIFWCNSVARDAGAFLLSEGNLELCCPKTYTKFKQQYSLHLQTVLPQEDFWKDWLGDYLSSDVSIFWLWRE